MINWNTNIQSFSDFVVNSLQREIGFNLNTSISKYNPTVLLFFSNSSSRLENQFFCWIQEITVTVGTVEALYFSIAIDSPFSYRISLPWNFFAFSNCMQTVGVQNLMPNRKLKKSVLGSIRKTSSLSKLNLNCQMVRIIRFSVLSSVLLNFKIISAKFILYF